MSARKVDSGLFNCFLKTFHFSNQSQERFTIFLRIKQNLVNFERNFEIFGVSGDNKIIEDAIFHCLKGIYKKVKKMNIYKKKNIDITNFVEELKELDEKDLNSGSGNLNLNSETIFPNDAFNYNENTVLDKANQEANNIYEYYNILSNTKYDLGKDINAFIQKFKTDNEDVFESAKSLPFQVK
jgi:hypothetical protein